MPEVLVATPLKSHNASKPYEFADGMCIRELSPILWDKSIAKGSIAERDREHLSEVRYWLCATEQCDRFHSVTDHLVYKALHAAWALQIICPTGAKHIFLTFNQTSQGYDNISLFQPKELCSTELCRINNLEDQELQQHFDVVYGGIRRAFSEQIVRLQNPVQLLEHGMQIGNPNLGALMFVMGLDVLFMAGESDAFVKRIGGFLGLDTYVFPPDAIMNRRPKTLVRDVINDLYEFRNIVAHGQEIPKHPYRETTSLTSTDERSIVHKPYYYSELLLDASLFLLTAALRKILTEGLFDDVKNIKTWRERMTLYEHRYKDSGGLPSAKLRGR